MKKLSIIVFMISFLSKLFGGEAPIAYQTAEIYRTMRQQIFDLPKEKIDLGANDRLAIIMETGLEDACYTLAAIADGRIAERLGLRNGANESQQVRRFAAQETVDKLPKEFKAWRKLVNI